MFSKLQFLIKSTNQHGVHSPFVYNYITKGLYEDKRDCFETHNTNRWLLQSIKYFKPNTIYFLDEGLSAVVNKMYSKKITEPIEADLILEKHTHKNEQRILNTIINMNSSQILLIATYNYPQSFLDELRKNSEITLVVDFYYGCLISKRAEQLKQNFFIRY